MNRRLSYLVLIALVIVGCSPSGKKTDAPNSGGANGKPDIKTDPTTPADATVVTPKPSPSDLPASVKHAGFEWYGLGHGKSVKMTLNQGGTKMTGEQMFELEKIEGDAAIYKQNWSGQLQFNGDIRVRVDAKGVYGIEAQGQKMDPPELELPANPTPGYAWKSTGKINLNGGTVENTSCKIIGIKSIKVGGRTVSALAVQRISQLKTGGKAQKMDAVEYYEKGVGTVKLEVKLSGGGQPFRSFSMEATP